MGSCQQQQWVSGSLSIYIGIYLGRDNGHLSKGIGTSADLCWSRSVRQRDHWAGVSAVWLSGTASIGYPYIARWPYLAHVAGPHAEKPLRIEEAGEVLAVDRDGWVQKQYSADQIFSMSGLLGLRCSCSDSYRKPWSCYARFSRNKEPCEVG